MHGHVCYKKVNFATKISAVDGLTKPPVRIFVFLHDTAEQKYNIKENYFSLKCKKVQIFYLKVRVRLIFKLWLGNVVEVSVSGPFYETSLVEAKKFTK
jgi:hypothetical protein